MDHHSSRRGRSPPFGYDGRPMMSSREFDSPYNSFEGPPRHHPAAPGGCMIPIPGVGPHDDMGLPMIEHPHRQGYIPNYRDRIPSTYRNVVREPYPMADPPSGSSSPSYKILCITNINHKIDDATIKNALISEFCRFGDISVSICHDSGERLAYIYFRSPEEAREARFSKKRALFFDRPIDIEPIYEPSASPTEGPSPIPQMQSMHPTALYSQDGRRSCTPTDFPQSDLNGGSFSQRRPVAPNHMPQHHVPTPPLPMNHRPLSPSEYVQPHATGYGSHGPSRSPMGSDQVPLGVFDRRGNHKAHYHPQNRMSPYSPPSHDPYKYPPPQFYEPTLHPNVGPLVQPAIPTHRVPRERPYIDGGYPNSRGLRPAEPYFPPEQRAPPSQPTHSSRSSSRPVGYPAYQRASPIGHQTSGRHSPAPPSVHRYRQRPISPPQPFPTRASQTHNEPPMRFMSREFRRERFGIAEPHGEQEDGRPSRVLLVNDVDATKTESHLREIFEHYGIIEEIEIKKVTAKTASALIRFSSMDGAYKAKSANHGRYVGNSKCNIVYGKVSASRRLWIGGLSSSTTVPSLEDECSKYGDLVNMEYTSGRPYCYVEYETANQAQFAAHHLRSTLVPAPDRKIRIEFVDPERSEKMSRHDANTQGLESKPRSNNETWAANETESSPQSVGGMKRSSSPMEQPPKRSYIISDLPLAANTFKQERLAAAAAAKARSASIASSNTETNSGAPINKLELNNNAKDSSVENNGVDNDSQANDVSRNDSNLQYDVPSLKILAQCSNIRDVVSSCSTSWPIQIALRNFIFPSTIHLCSGRKDLVDKYFRKAKDEADHPLLKITQRWRLHPQPKLEEVKKRMQTGNLGILIITSRQECTLNQREAIKSTSIVQEDPCPNNRNNDDHSETRGDDSLKYDATALDDSAARSSLNGSASGNQSNCNLIRTNSSNKTSTDHQNSLTAQTSVDVTKTTNSTMAPNAQSRPLRNLISYLEQKDAAGVISLNASEMSTVSEQSKSGTLGSGSDGNPKLLYAFPPGEFALNLIKHVASSLSSEISKEEFLLGVIVGSNVEGK